MSKSAIARPASSKSELGHRPSPFQDMLIVYSAIDLTPQVIENVFKPLAAVSGWTFEVIGAGPLPEDNGKISSMS